eukprot:jgi/Astpho2/2843/Aster-x1103
MVGFAVGARSPQQEDISGRPRSPHEAVLSQILQALLNAEQVDKNAISHALNSLHHRRGQPQQLVLHRPHLAVQAVVGKQFDIAALAGGYRAEEVLLLFSTVNSTTPSSLRSCLMITPRDRGGLGMPYEAAAGSSTTPSYSMAYQQTPTRANIEFLKSSKGCGGRVIRLAGASDPQLIPQQLQGRMDLATWAQFMGQVQHLADIHPYLASPDARQCCNWITCGIIGATIGICAVNPDSGDYGAWLNETNHMIAQWQPTFQKMGLALSLQHIHSTYHIQIDVMGAAPGYA